MTAIDPARLDANWRAILAELDVPRPRRLERALRTVGVPARTTRLILATPALRRAWFLAVGLAALVGLGAADPSQPRRSLFTLLLLAPLLPVAGVALAYGAGADPAHEVQLATPMSGLRLLALRAITVLVCSVLVVGVLSLLSDVTRPMAAAWLLPALAVTAASLALMTVVTPRRAATAVGVTWVVVAVVARAVSGDPLAAFTALGQVGAALVAVAAAGITVARRTSFDQLKVPA